MKKMILAAALLSGLSIVVPAMADEAHHPGQPGSPAPARKDGGELDTSLQQMRDLRKKIETAKDPATKKELMHQHMQMMRNGMEMMGMMGGKEMMPGEPAGKMKKKDPDTMPLADHMEMMEKMRDQEGGMAGGQGMMGSPSGQSMDDRLGMMEKKMMMMQEMMNGMMMQQEMMMK